MRNITKYWQRRSRKGEEAKCERNVNLRIRHTSRFDVVYRNHVWFVLNGERGILRATFEDTVGTIIWVLQRLTDAIVSKENMGSGKTDPSVQNCTGQQLDDEQQESEASIAWLL